MSDLISRQAAIDAIVAWTVEDRPDIEMPTDLVGRIESLPSAQPDLDSAYSEGYTAAESKYRAMWDEMQANIKEKAFGKRKGLIHTADIDAMPTIVPERKTGKWMKDSLCTVNGETYAVRRCSQCKSYFHDVVFTWNYCPNCGARMVQEGEEKE